MTQQLYHYRAEYVTNYDGDTVTFNIDLGCGIWKHRETVRLARINCPEINSQDPIKKAAAQVSASYVHMALVEPAKIMLKTIKDRREKYGRLLAEVFVAGPNEGDWLNLNDDLVAHGHALYATY